MKGLRPFTIAMLMAISVTAFTQTIRLKGGANLAKFFQEDDDYNYSDDYKIKPGFHLGPTIEFPITDLFNFEGGLLISSKGFKYDEEESGYSYKEKIKLTYVDIPLTAKAYYEGFNFRLFGFAGPQIGLGLSGKAITEENYGGDTFDEDFDLDFGSDENSDHFSKLELSAIIGIGIEFNALQISLHYNPGISNISADKRDGQTIRNNVIGVSASYIIAEL